MTLLVFPGFESPGARFGQGIPELVPHFGGNATSVENLGHGAKIAVEQGSTGLLRGYLPHDADGRMEKREIVFLQRG